MRLQFPHLLVPARSNGTSVIVCEGAFSLSYLTVPLLYKHRDYPKGRARNRSVATNFHLIQLKINGVPQFPLPCIPALCFLPGMGSEILYPTLARQDRVELEVRNLTEFEQLFTGWLSDNQREANHWPEMGLP